jgi:outer membrane protein TolC
MKSGFIIANLLLSSCFSMLSAQEKEIQFTLSQCIEMATESSLQAFRAKNQYLSSYWEFRTYQAGLLPSLSLQLTPIQYNSNLTKRYDYVQNIEVYRQQQSISSSGGLSVSQNWGLTGGTFTLNTDLDYLRNFGENVYTQYSSVPVRLGYSQNLFGFNRFKWDKKLEPLKFEKAKKQFLYEKEAISAIATQYFFNLATAQAEYEMAVENLASSDSLYLAGKERSRIASISQADLQTLQLDWMNAENAVENTLLNLQKSTNSFLSFFKLAKMIQIHLQLPEPPEALPVSTEEALQLMKENNPDILAYRRQILESEMAVEQTQKNAQFSAQFSASVGFNQAANIFRETYLDPSRQDRVSATVTIPLVDWGIRKGRVNMAKNNLNVTRLTVEQSEQDLEQELVTLMAEFHLQKKLIRKAMDALEIAISSYNINKQRFIVGKTDISTLTLSLNRRKEAQRNYLSILGNYWRCYYSVRKMTLFDTDT